MPFGNFFKSLFKSNTPKELVEETKFKDQGIEFKGMQKKSEIINKFDCFYISQRIFVEGKCNIEEILAAMKNTMIKMVRELQSPSEETLHGYFTSHQANYWHCERRRVPQYIWVNLYFDVSKINSETKETLKKEISTEKSSEYSLNETVKKVLFGLIQKNCLLGFQVEEALSFCSSVPSIEVRKLLMNESGSLGNPIVSLADLGISVDKLINSKNEELIDPHISSKMTN